MWVIYALLSALFAGLTAVLGKVGVKGIDSDLATAIRTAVVLMLTWGIVFFKKAPVTLMQLTKQNILFLVLSGLATGGSWIFYYKALQLGKVSQVAPVDKLSVVFAILLSMLFLGESLSAKEMAGAALIVAGALVIIW
ncbi:MAG: EamA family transporter [Chitinophagaceae bacterium]|nr:MAG: EamA family transporter [Chitinophagaceae bacterium]